MESFKRTRKSILQEWYKSKEYKKIWTMQKPEQVYLIFNTWLMTQLVQARQKQRKGD